MARTKRRGMGRNWVAALSFLALSPMLTGCNELFWGGSSIFAGLLTLDIGLIPVRSLLGQMALSIFNGTFP